MKLTCFRKVIIICFGLFLLLQSSGIVSAFGSLSLEPVTHEGEGIRHTFKYVLSEGEELEDYIVLTNTGNETVTAMIIPSGHLQEDGKLIIVEPKDEDIVAKLDPGYWVEILEQEIKLPPGSSKLVGFKIKVPENADVGDHVGSILTAERIVENKNSIKGSGMSIITQVGARLTVTIPGDVFRELLINSITHKINKKKNRLLTFEFNLTNNSNISLRPTIDIDMKGLLGFVGSIENEGFASIVRGDTVLAGKSWIKRAPYFGRFVADFDIHLGEHTQLNKDGTTTLLPDEIISAKYIFWIFPWIELLYLLLLVLMLYIVRSIWLYIIVVRRLKTKTEIYTVKAGDTLTIISKKLNVNAKVLARFNMMVWPYEVIVGDKLLMPVGVLTGSEWRKKEKEMLSDKEIMGGIFGHLLFKKRNMHKVAGKLDKSKPKPEKIIKSLKNTEILIVEAGDTIKDIADFAKTTKKKIMEYNQLASDNDLYEGQEIIVPKKKSARRKSVNKINK